MRLLIGKWYLALRFRNDLCVGFGQPDEELRGQVVRERNHRGI